MLWIVLLYVFNLRISKTFFSVFFGDVPIPIPLQFRFFGGAGKIYPIPGPTFAWASSPWWTSGGRWIAPRKRGSGSDAAAGGTMPTGALAPRRNMTPWRLGHYAESIIVGDRTRKLMIIFWFVLASDVCYGLSSDASCIWIQVWKRG